MITVAQVPLKAPDPNETFSTQTIKLPSLTANDALLELEYVSVDPYIRGQLAQFHALQQPVESFCVAKVVDVGLNVSKFTVNDSVMGIFPWQTHAIVNMDSCHLIPRKAPKYNPDCDTFNNDEMIDLSSIPKSYYIGQFGMPGKTGYYGLFEKGNIKSGENILISGGAGAVGSMVAQFAKMIGCKKIIGTAGSDGKLKFMKNMGFTDVLNYKDYHDTQSMQDKLKVS